MKIKSILNKLTFVCCVLLAIAISCKKDYRSQEQPKQQELDKLKQWYQTNLKVVEENPFSKLEPDWSRIYQSDDGGQIVYEVEISNSEKLTIANTYLDRSKLDGLTAQQSIKLLLFETKATGTIRYASYMSHVGQGTVQPNKLHYKNVGDFSGTLYFHHFDGRFANGWKYENGKLTNKLNAISLTEYQQLTKNKEKTVQSYEVCTEHTVDVYFWACIGVETQTSCGWHYRETYYVTMCRMMAGPDDGTGGTGGPGGPGGSGGNGGYLPPIYIDCANVENGQAYWSTQCNMCIGGTTGIEACPPTEEEFEEQIKNKLFALFDDTVDCELLKKWLNVAKFKSDQSILDKLNGVIFQIPGYTDNMVARVQNIDDASSTIVNMDYFSVTINQLPTYNGQQFTAGELLKYIRMNLNGLTNGEKQFHPYNTYGINDVDLWNSTNPKGAIIAIDLPGPENGTVITTYSSSDRWTFTTIYEPMYGEHPVSGNRDFGYIHNPNGSYTFYTKGVDRLTSWYHSSFQEIPEMFGQNGIPFSSADALWKSFQNGIKNFVNGNGGNASINIEQTFRPDWNKVKKVIEGKAPLGSLSKNCAD